MVRPQEGRPTESTFIGAALRFTKGEYEPTILHTTVGYFAQVHQVYPQRKRDMDTILDEWRAEGLAGHPESISDFALRQLSKYQKLRKPS